MLRYMSLLALLLFFFLFKTASFTSPHTELALGIPVSGALQKATPTPQAEDVSEIGSTDGIIVLGGLIALIALTPIFLYRRVWETVNTPQ